jgi:chromosome partitioning protein
VLIQGLRVRVVSVMNYKGGVGKTTLTANLAAETARLGYRVLTVDLDPQSNLTFSFYSAADWHEDLRESRTIKRWFDSRPPGRDVPLRDLVLTPPRVNDVLKRHLGQLDMIASHLGLIDIDLQLALALHDGRDPALGYLQVHGSLGEALHDPFFQTYDLVLIDCAPNFGLVTKAAIAASDYIIVPAKPDYLSTLGIGYMVSSLHLLVDEFNRNADRATALGYPTRHIAPEIAGAVFTMTHIHDGRPINAQRNQIAQVYAEGITRVFRATVRNSARFFAEAGESGVPAVLRGAQSDLLTVELRALTDEILSALTEKGPRR